MRTYQYLRIRKGQLEFRNIRVRDGRLATADLVMSWMGWQRPQDAPAPKAATQLRLVP